MQAVGLLLDNQNAESLADIAQRLAHSSARIVLYRRPGMGIYGRLHHLTTIQQTAEDRHAAALDDLRQRYPQAERLLATDGERDVRIDAARSPVASMMLSHTEFRPPTTDHTQRTSIATPTLMLPPSELTNVELLIKSFRRFGCLRRLVESIRRFYPDLPIQIADDSFETVPDRLPPDADAVHQMQGVTWHQLPFDVGLSAGRNFLVRASKAEFVVNLDDDFVFTRETRLDVLLYLLTSVPETDLVTGLVRWDGLHAANYAGHFRFEPVTNGQRRYFLVEPLQQRWRTDGGVRYQPTHLGFNFFAARREVLLRAKWDDRFKICYEHMDHFLEMHSQQIRVLTTPDVVIGHLKQVSDPDYRKFRMRGNVCQKLLLDKWQIRELPGCSIKPVDDLSPLDVRADVTAQQRLDPPNRILFGVGHSGTSIVTRMLSVLGYYLGQADDEFSEHVGIRDINQRILQSGLFDSKAAREQLQRLPKPWVIKDPRFVHTIEMWLPVLSAWEPELLWLVRDQDAVSASFRRRHQGISEDGRIISRYKTIAELHALAQETYRTWPWRKRRIHYNQVLEAVKLFDVSAVERAII